jgi:hypothetical protein
MLSLLAAAVVATVASGLPLRPDPALTPGATNPAITQANIATTICIPGYTSKPGIRHVTAATKAGRFKAYGIDPHGQGAPFEIDHLISLELGGSNDPANLWPESYVTEGLNAHLKDALENKLHALVCARTVPLAEAQHEISTDWPSAYLKYVGPLK